LPKAFGIGMKGIRVDGNDAIAVYEAVKYARDFILKNKEPFFIEAMTYRVGDHSTSDHSLLYRQKEEIDEWDQQNNPIERLRNFLKSYE
jgi:2-oxoisovalerate dehydrogenase E1 component alpha subunit